MKLNIDENKTILQLEKEQIISDNKAFYVFLTDSINALNKYDNVLIYENITYANLSDYKYCVIIQK